MSKPDTNRFTFKPGILPPETRDAALFAKKLGITLESAKVQVERFAGQRVMMSSTYQVNIEEVPVNGWGVTMTWLSIKRRDKAAFHDWRELQGIKNAICGPEREAVELYPAESRLVDTANQYHLWVLPADMGFPFGYWFREVTGESKHGAVQRPMESVGVAA